MKWKIMSNTITVGLYWMGTSHNEYNLNGVTNWAKTGKQNRGKQIKALK